MRGWWREIAGLVLPVACGGCGGPRTVLCPVCAGALTGTGPRRVRPDPEPEGLPVVHAVAPYADAVRELLLAHKERGALALAGPLGGALAAAVAAAAGPATGLGSPPLLLVPVPSSRRSVRARGHDPTRRIALAAAARLRGEGRAARVVPVLRQRRYVADQAGLGARGRLANLSGALELVPGGARLVEAGKVVLVDDLMTTGASLAEAARALGDVHLPFIPGLPQGMAGRAAGASAQHGFEQRQAAVIASSPASFEINRN
ncbi:ComF family protein [Streptomyces sp. NPDC006482]|uniref:ComF family protein n=1 Tax=Streptomyces sp. NPDC006482 TaxID=3154306 RepID=UPI0033A1499F